MEYITTWKIVISVLADPALTHALLLDIKDALKSGGARTLQKRKRMSRWYVADVKAHVDLQVFDFPSQIFLRFTNSLLQPSEQLMLFSLGKREIIIAQPCVFLFQ